MGERRKREKGMKKKNLIIFCLLMGALVGFGLEQLYAEPIAFPDINLTVGGEQANLGSTIQIIIVLTVLAIAPSILLMMTSFTRILIIFSFLRRALSLQTTPPNQILIGLSLFLTFYIMSPVFQEVYSQAYIPLTNNEITQEEAFEKASAPMKEFMLKHVRKDDLALFVKISDSEVPKDIKDISMWALIPAFVISELKTAFIVGFLLFIPFMIIDMVVASTLMALGMMMLPPVMISMPFKLLLFIMVDGWNMITGAVVKGFGL